MFAFQISTEDVQTGYEAWVDDQSSRGVQTADDVWGEAISQLGESGEHHEQLEGIHTVRGTDGEEKRSDPHQA
jgi:hypothetical protein